MHFRVRPFEAKDEAALARLMVVLQEHLVHIDPLHRLRLEPGYDRAYAQDVLEKLMGQEGALFIAEDATSVIGCCACIIERQNTLALLGEMPLVDGRIIELVVVPSARGHGVASALMQRAEEYLREKGCDAVRVEVFVPNDLARHLYEKLGYTDRMVDMVKVL